MENPKHRVTLVENLETNLVNQMGPLQPSIPGKRAYLVRFRRDIAAYLKSGEITEAEQEKLEQMAQVEQEKLGNS
ncbi:MAG: hypothetical protein AAB612_02275 [Patescibacteria group bacterium]